MKKKPSTFRAKILQLRKEQGWSQPQLGRMVGTSGTIIGRYERGGIAPSIEVARKLADAFGVTVASLIDDRDLPEILSDQKMLQRWTALADPDEEDREKILYLSDGLIRDARARRAYTAVG